MFASRIQHREQQSPNLALLASIYIILLAHSQTRAFAAKADDFQAVSEDATLLWKVVAIYNHGDLGDVSYTRRLLSVKFSHDVFRYRPLSGDGGYFIDRMTSYGLGGKFPSLTLTYTVPIKPPQEMMGSLVLSNFSSAECIRPTDMTKTLGRSPDHYDASTNPNYRFPGWECEASQTLMSITLIASASDGCVNTLMLGQSEKVKTR